jgi:hypothetical protein
VSAWVRGTQRPAKRGPRAGLAGTAALLRWLADRDRPASQRPQHAFERSDLRIGVVPPTVRGTLAEDIDRGIFGVGQRVLGIEGAGDEMA